MNSFNDEVCEFNSMPITENFQYRFCKEGEEQDTTGRCPSGCRSPRLISPAVCSDGPPRSCQYGESEWKECSSGCIKWSSVSNSECLL
jgi:hypothetical protein